MLCLPAVEELDWEHTASHELSSATLQLLQPLDIILAAGKHISLAYLFTNLNNKSWKVSLLYYLFVDVVFDKTLIQPLAATLSKILHTSKNPDCSALVASTIRNQETYNTFIKSLGEW